MNMVWTFNKSDRMYNILDEYADKMEQVGIFNFTVDETGLITGTVEQRIIDIASRHEGVRWLLTIQNEGTRNSVVNALVNDSYARTNFMSELNRLMNQYTWCSGIDIDLENCGDRSMQAGMKALMDEIYASVRSMGKVMNICLPPITGPNNSVGGEYWCAYEDYSNSSDTVAIMSYAFSWLGSAPGPVSPKWWIEEILEYATRCIPKDKILIGLGAWAIMWGLHHAYDGYKANSGTFYWPMTWANGENNFYDFREGEGRDYEEDRQVKLPFCAYWDDYSKICYMMPYVYDYVDGDMYSSSEVLVTGNQQGRNYVVSFSKVQKVTGEYSKQSELEDYEGSVILGTNYIASKAVTVLTEEEQEWLDYRIEQVGYDGLTQTEKDLYQSTQPGMWTYNINIREAGEYRLCLDLNFPWFDKNGIMVKLDGIDISVTENRYWNPTFRTRHLEQIYVGNLSAGNHTIICGELRGKFGAVCYGVCYGKSSDYSTEIYAGDAKYNMVVQKMEAEDGTKVSPSDSYAVTTELLRQKPDSSNIWYDDFRSYYMVANMSQYYSVEGNFGLEIIPAKQQKYLAGTGRICLKDATFLDAEIYVRWESVQGKIGVEFGSYFICYDSDEEEYQIWLGQTKVESVVGEDRGAISARFRSSTIRVYAGTNKNIVTTYDCSIQNGAPGLKCTGKCKVSLFRVGSAWWYEPYECVKIDVAGVEQTLGRVERTGVTWDNELGQFCVNTDIDESETRTEEISQDYDFVYCGRQQQLNGSEGYCFVLGYKPVDVNIRHMRTYVGDGDGFGIMYYEDSDVLRYWINRVIYEYEIAGVCIWSLGQEDCRIWEQI